MSLASASKSIRYSTFSFFFDLPSSPSQGLICPRRFIALAELIYQFK